MKIYLFKPYRFARALLKVCSTCFFAVSILGHAAEPLSSASSAEELTDYLTTGEDAKDVGVYWHCEPLNTDQNIHLRLWGDDSGFSGRQDVRWEVLDTQRISITYSNGTFELSDIRFGNERYVADSLQANDSSGDSITCERVGPHRDRSTVQALFQDVSGSLLERQLMLEESQFWNCDNSGGLGIETLEFNTGAEGIVNAEPMRWFVDEQYNVVMSDASSDRVIHGVEMTRADYLAGEAGELYAGENPDILTGYIGDSRLVCNHM